jgi:excinuclease ABC subunit C
MSLAESLKKVPNSSGVYQYFDEFDKLLYVGKAKNLKNRVKSYFRFTPSLQPSPTLSPRIHKMVSEAKDIRYILVANEYDALILENSLIKQLKPKYNILLRDDKTYPYISIDLEEDFPRFEITRKIKNKKGIKYFGPFTSSSREILEALYILHPLVQKKNCLNSKKVCLFYQIGKCHAPCVGKIDKQQYRDIVDKALYMLKNKKSLLEPLTQKMFSSANLENYEEAGKLRDMIKAIRSSLHVSTGIDLANLENLDIFCIQIKEKSAAIIKIFLRDGKIVSTNHNIIKNTQGFEKDELYKRALLQFYTKNSPMLCKNILVGDDFRDIKDIEKYLEATFKKKIKIIHPKIGDKAKLIQLSKQNASYLLKNEIDKKDILIQIKNLFDLDEIPYRIEIFDNSHLGGVAAVGGMVVWEEKFIKSDYKKFTLHSIDEYSQMRELLRRRADDFIKNPPPNLWLIDGGSTLVKLAKEILQENDIKLDVLGISKEKLDAKSVRSKGSAKDIIHYNSLTVNLKTNDARLLFLQKLRDEAHRFAITFHQQKKIKKDLVNLLTSIPGIGHATQKKLLAYFGTYDAIYSATLEELKMIIHEKLAISLIKEIKLYVFK